VVGVSANVIGSGARWGHEDDLVFTRNQIHTDHNGLDDLALANSTFTSDIKEGLSPLEGVATVSTITCLSRVPRSRWVLKA
jgi:hypothetical protein